MKIFTDSSIQFSLFPPMSPSSSSPSKRVTRSSGAPVPTAAASVVPRKSKKAVSATADSKAAASAVATPSEAEKAKARRSNTPQPPAASDLPPVDFDAICYPEVQYSRRVCPPGLKRLVLDPAEKTPFEFEDPESYNSFYFLDHPDVADLVVYFRNNAHVLAQDPKVLELLFWKAAPVFVRALFKL